jgi:XTP/dITP diphosphohydrolase
MMNIILSTRNPSKTEQIKAMFTNPLITVLTLDEAGIEGEAVEDGATLGENAMKKVTYAKEQLKEPAWIMADDTGLFITALDGKPGIHAARWAGDVSTKEITEYTLKQLEGKTDRSATFKTVVYLISPEGQTFQFEGAVNGQLAESAQAEAQPKMPYSPLFSPEGTGKVWAQMTTEEENAVSHRGKAFRQVVAFLEKELEN